MSTTVMPDEGNASSLSTGSNASVIAATPTKSTTPKSFHQFLKLPIELRAIVYNFALAKKKPLICANCDNSGFGLGPAEKHGPIVEVALLATSKQVNDEAKNEFLLKNTFRLNDMNVCKLRTSEAQRSTLRDARHLIVLFQPQRHVYKDAWVFEFEFPRFRHLETLYLILYTAVEPNPVQYTQERVGRELNAWGKLWVGRQATIEWRDTEQRKIAQTPKYLQERKVFEDYLRSLEKAMVKGERPAHLQTQEW